MTMPYMKGWGDTLAETLPQIGNNIAHIVNPNLDQQTALKQAIAKDPTLLQSIANNPGLADALQKMGLGNVPQSTQGLAQDPRIALGNQILGNQARSTGAAADLAQQTLPFDVEKNKADAISASSKARVDQATEKDAIDLAGSQARTMKLNADKAEQEYTIASDVLRQHPSVAGIDPVKLVGDAANGRSTPEGIQQLMRIAMAPGGKEAVQGLFQAALNRQDNAARLTIAEIKKKDPDYQVAALGGLERQIKEINDRITSNNTTIKNTAPNFMKLNVDAKSKDPAIAANAQQQIGAYQAAIKEMYGDGTDKSPTLQTMWQDANSKRSAILAGLGGGKAIPSTPSANASPATSKSLTTADLNQYKAAFAGGQIEQAKLDAALSSGQMTQDNYNYITGGKPKPSATPKSTPAKPKEKSTLKTIGGAASTAIQLPADLAKLLMTAPGQALLNGVNWAKDDLNKE